MNPPERKLFFHSKPLSSLTVSRDIAVQLLYPQENIFQSATRRKNVPAAPS